MTAPNPQEEITKLEAELKTMQDKYLQADQVMKNGFLLGAHHGMTTQDVVYVCDKIIE